MLQLHCESSFSVTNRLFPNLFVGVNSSLLDNNVITLLYFQFPLSGMSFLTLLTHCLNHFDLHMSLCIGFHSVMYSTASILAHLVPAPGVVAKQWISLSDIALQVSPSSSEREYFFWCFVRSQHLVCLHSTL